MLLGNTNSCVLNLELQLALVQLCPNRDRSFIRELHSIPQQIVQNLIQSILVSEDTRELLWQLRNEHHSFLAHCMTQYLQHGVYSGSYIYSSKIELEPAIFEIREVQNIVDKV
ncbi:hypothetical protein D1872_218050 [compost metagenome]